MILIDKLCYQSKLRYVNATEKFVYAVLSLVFCIVSRSAAAAVLVFLANGILTVGKGKIPLSHYIKLLLVPAAFLLSRLAGPVGVWNAFWVAEAATAVIAFFIYRKAVAGAE